MDAPTNVLTLGDLTDAHEYAMRRITKALCTGKGILGDEIMKKNRLPCDHNSLDKCVKYQTKKSVRALRVSEGVATHNDTGDTVYPANENGCPVDFVYQPGTAADGGATCVWSSERMYEEFDYDRRTGRVGPESSFLPSSDGVPLESGISAYHHIEDGKCVITDQRACHAASHTRYNSLLAPGSCVLEAERKNVTFNPYFEWRENAGLCDVIPAKPCTSDDDCPEYNFCYGTQPAWGDDLNGLDWAKWVVGMGGGQGGAGQCRASPMGQICPYGNVCAKNGQCGCTTSNDCAGSATCVNGACEPKSALADSEANPLDQDTEGAMAGQCVYANDGMVDMMTAPQCKCPEQNPVSSDGSDATLDCRESQDFTKNYVNDFTKSPPMNYDEKTGSAAITPEYCKYYGRKFTSGKQPSSSDFDSGSDKANWEPCNVDSDCKVVKGGENVNKPGYVCHLFPKKVAHSTLGFNEAVPFGGNTTEDNAQEWPNWLGITTQEWTDAKITTIADAEKEADKTGGVIDKDHMFKGVCVGQDTTCWTPLGYVVAGSLTGNTVMYGLANYSRFKKCTTKGMINKLGNEFFGANTGQGNPNNPFADDPWTATGSQKKPPTKPDPDTPPPDPATLKSIQTFIRQALNSRPFVDEILLPPESNAILVYPHGVGASHVYAGRRPGSHKNVLQFDTGELLRLFPENCTPEGDGVRFKATSEEAARARGMKRLYYFVQNSDVLANTFLSMVIKSRKKQH